MSQIINPERRDPSFLKNKADVGLSKVDNFSVFEIQDMIHGALREEYSKGDIYGEKELLEKKELYIPLCKFKEETSRATITIGLLNSNKEIKTYVRAFVRYSFLKNEVDTDTNGNIPPFFVEFEKSANNIFPAELQIYSSLTEAVLYLKLPKNLYSSYDIYGITINITEELISEVGSKLYKNIEILDHTKIISETNHSILEKYPEIYSVLIGASDRSISSFSRSLSLYDKSSGIMCFPDNFNGKDIKDTDNIDFPTINGVPFTGDKNITHHNGKSLRNITISAQHPGKTRDQAGEHDWSVLSGIPVNSYTPDGKAEISSINKGDSFGLTKIVDIPEDIKFNENPWKMIENLNRLVSNTSLGNDESVVSIGYLRKFTNCLTNILSLLTQRSTDIRFFSWDDLDTPVLELQISPNYNYYTQYRISGLDIESIYKIELENSGDLELECHIQNDIIGENGFEEGDEFKAYSSGVDIRIITKSHFNVEQLNSNLSEVRLSLSQKNNEGEEYNKLTDIPIIIRLDGVNNVFRRKERLFPIVFSHVVDDDYIGTIGNSSYKDTQFITYDSKGGGFIWETKDSGKLISGLVTSPENCTYRIKGYSLRKDYYGDLLSNEVLERLSYISGINIKIYSEGIYKPLENRNNEIFSLETWGFEKDEIEEYSFILEFTVSNINNLSIFDFKELTEIPLTCNKTQCLNLKLVSRPQSIILSTSEKSLRPFIHIPNIGDDLEEMLNSREMSLYLPVKISNISNRKEEERIWNLLEGNKSYPVEWMISKKSSLDKITYEGISVSLVFADDVEYKEYNPQTSKITMMAGEGLYLKFSGPYLSELEKIIEDSSISNIFKVPDFIYTENYSEYPNELYSINSLFINSGGWRYALDFSLWNIKLNLFDDLSDSGKESVWTSSESKVYYNNTQILKFGGKTNQDGSWKVDEDNTVGAYTLRLSLNTYNNYKSINDIEIGLVGIDPSTNRSISVLGRKTNGKYTFNIGEDYKNYFFKFKSTGNNYIPSTMYIYGDNDIFYFIPSGKDFDGRIIQNYKLFEISLLSPGSDSK